MSRKRKVLQGSASNLIRVLLSMLVSLVLPPFLVRHMAAAEYSAWVLILQLSAYVGLLDFGLQVAIGKFVAEYDASGDRESSHSLVSTSFTLLSAAAAVACGAIAVIALSVPRLFHQMPAELVPEVRIAILAVGLSTAIALPFSTFASTFTGLQQYIFPTVLATVTRVGSAASLIILLLLHASLVQMALVLAAFNVASAAAQFLGWQKFIKQRVAFSFLVFHRRSALKLAKYGSVLSIWTLSMLLISGLDVVIVGHYHYQDTGFYSVANGAATFMLALISSAFGPLVPAVSSLQSTSTPERLGDLCIRTTRYCTLLLLLLGLPLFFGAYPLLGLWVGKRFADQSAMYLEVLVAANVVRQLAFAYILIVVATGRQHLATLSQVVEACVNIVLSLWLVQRIGTVGVALGTFAGAFVGLGMHLMVSMPRTQPTIRLEYSRFLLEGLLRPLLLIIPALCFYPFWRRLNMLPAQPWILALWAIITAAIAWWMVLTAQDRQEVKIALHRLSDRRLRKNA